MSNTLAALQVRVDRLCRARDEEARRRSNPLRIVCWLPAKDGVEYEKPPPFDRGDGIAIYIIRDTDRPEFDKWMNDQEDET